MIDKILRLAITVAALGAPVAWAQPPDVAVFPGDEQPNRGRLRGQRLERITEFLELDEAQTREWQTLLEQHFDSAAVHRDEVELLRDEFQELAQEPSPDLEQLGQIALDIHRQMESARNSREQLLLDLAALLTPEQMDRFEALRAAREVTAAGFGRRGHRGRRNPPESE